MKFPLVRMSASWFVLSMYFDCILGLRHAKKSVGMVQLMLKLGQERPGCIPNWKGLCSLLWCSQVKLEADGPLRHRLRDIARVRQSKGSACRKCSSNLAQKVGDNVPARAILVELLSPGADGDVLNG